ncbi:MAG TPA: HAMP domain-containing sensor histidine kinase [Gemmatimonadaceae bacterium]|nr:HAMP domain-containing sensor histidine kinase [Gemmatimonadaceae bacterium]
MSPSPRSSRSLGIVALLALAVVLVAVLAYQAQDAARSHRRTAERALHDYASFANWQLTQQAKNSLLTTIITSLAFPASSVNPRDLQPSLFSPAEVEEVARRTVRWCDCLDSARYFFRYDWKDGTFRTTDTRLSDADLAWARDTVVEHVKAMPPVPERRPLSYGSPDGQYGPLRQLGVVLTNDSYVMIAGERHGEQQLLVFVVARDPTDGTPVVVYGYETPPAPFVWSAFSLLERRTPLLPPSLLGDIPQDSVVAIAVTDRAGRPIYRSWRALDSGYTARDTLESNFGELVVSLGLRPRVADRLLVGGLPQSRLGILLAIFALTAGLLAVALVLMRRQQELAQLRTDFVSGVSHELRTPLAQIRWFAELLHMGKLRSDEERARSAGIIDQEARRLTYLVENVLNFSRAERGTNRISPAPVDLDAEIRETLDAFAPLARARRVRMRAELELGLVAEVDRDALRQVLVNVLDNAVKYGPTGQTVAVGTQERDGMARIWVEDEGPGIPPAERFRVWEPYVRLTRASESATGGSGIGLSVVRELVKLHGGRCWAEPGAAGHGTRIVIELPLSRGAGDSPARADDTAAHDAAYVR